MQGWYQGQGMSHQILFKKVKWLFIQLCCYTLTQRMFGLGCFWLETTIIIKIESHPFYPIICWFHWGWSKKKSKWPTQKTEIFKTANSQYFFDKILGIGLWIYRINWCEWLRYGSTHMVVRLSEWRPKIHFLL